MNIVGTVHSSPQTRCFYRRNMKDFVGYKKGVNFGGWLSQCSEYTEEHYENFITEEDFKTVAEWGLDHIRVPVDFQVFQNPDGTLIEKGFSYVQNAIDCCKKYNLNMILDLHKTIGFSFDMDYTGKGFFDDEKLQSYFYILWEEFTKRFSKYKDMLAFELLNEVTSPSLSDKWNRIINKTVNLIRKTAPDIKILVGGYWNNSIDALKDLEPPADENIVYNFHCYEPFLFTHQAAGWLSNMPHDLKMDYPCNYERYNKTAQENNLTDFLIHKPIDSTNKIIVDADYFISRFEEGLKICRERQVPLYCGEYGVIDNAKPDQTILWYKDITKAFRHHNIGCAFWTYKSMSFGLQEAHMKDVKKQIIDILK